MTFEDILEYYKTQYNFHKLTGMSVNTFKNWQVLGYIPMRSQLVLERLTDGILTAHTLDSHK